MVSKSQCPHFFCWPGVFLTFEEENEQTDAIQNLIGAHMPPFQSSSLEAGVDTLNLQLDHQAKERFVSDYFATQVLYDLARQWISSPGEFSLEYQWKGILSLQERKTLKDRFYATFGLKLDDIPISR